MNRRTLLKLTAASSLLSGLPSPKSSSNPGSALTGSTRRRVRPSDPSWPSLAECYWLRVFRLTGLTCKVLGLLILVLSPEPIYGPLFLGGQNDEK